MELINGLPSGDNIGRIGLDISISNPDILYAFYDQHINEDEDYSFRGIFKTTDGGESWYKIQRELGEIRMITWAPI